jgi:hypothetical protein
MCALKSFHVFEESSNAAAKKLRGKYTNQDITVSGKFRGFP